jgi:hypothetical protein
LLAALMVALAQGCVSIPKRTPVPESLINEAGISGIADARVWGDAPLPYEAAWMAQSRAELQERYPALFGHQHHYLAISGGGAKGAFGAGLLKGWTAAGNRPEFSMVTGISTGSLTAPFAFLGPGYDHTLEEMYTAYSTKDLVNRRNLLTAVTSDALASTNKLAALITRYVDREVVEAIAREYQRGRVLNIGTTNLDAQRPVIWNIGRIAASGQPGSVELIQQIILASTAIPGAFPPVAIEVEAAGNPYDELHVDGGAASQVFLYPATINWARVLDRLEVPARPQVYVIRNSWLDPEAAAVERKLFPITGRTIGSLIRTQGIGDLYRIYTLTQRDGLDFNLAHIPADFTDKPSEQFDPVWMRKLFERGYELGKEGYPWKDAPPDFVK